MIVGLIGKMSSGKDTVARFLVKQGFTEYKHTTALTQFLLLLDPIVTSGMTHYSTVFNFNGYEASKRNFVEVRRLQRSTGQGVRDFFGPDLWVQKLWEQIDLEGKDNVVISDCRYPNEALEVRNSGGYMVKIVRDSVETEDPHPSESGQEQVTPDYVIYNNGTLEDLELAVKEMLGRYGYSR